VVKELLITERTYLQVLWVLVNHFQRPMFEVSFCPPSGWGISAEQIKSIFAYIDIIHRFTAMLLNQLGKRLLPLALLLSYSLALLLH